MENQFQFEIPKYRTLNQDVDFLSLKGTRFRRNDRLCKKAFSQFLHLRGEILTKAVAIEHEVDCAICAYFVSATVPEEDQDHQAAFMDLVLGSGGISVATKVAILGSIVARAEIHTPQWEKVRKPCMEINRIRNDFAHQTVGIDWQSQQVSLGNAKCRRWDPITEEFTQDFEEKCRKAGDWVHRIWIAIVRERRGRLAVSRTGT